MAAAFMSAARLAERAIEHLRSLPHGAEASTSGIADALNHAPPALVLQALTEAAERGEVFRRKKADTATAPWWWSLVDHEERARELREHIATLNRGAPPPPAAREVITITPKVAAFPFPPAPCAAPAPVAASAPSPAPRRPTLTADRVEESAAAVAPPNSTQPREVGSNGLNGNPGRVAKAAARASLSTARLPNVAETAAATPSGELRFCMWHDGTLEVWDAGKRLASFEPEQTLQLADYFGAIVLGDGA